MKLGVLVGLLLATPIMTYAVERTLAIDAPASITADQNLVVTIGASTDAVGEQVGFLQVESSVDGGETWVAICYLQNSGPKAEQAVTLKSGSIGTVVRIRARAAFRGGLAGDVDYLGAAILWDRNWKLWEQPPAKHASVTVVAE